MHMKSWPLVNYTQVYYDNGTAVTKSLFIPNPV